MIFFLFGEDTFRISRRLKEIIEEYLKKGFSLRVFDFSNSDFSEFKKEIANGSLFNRKRIFVVKQLSLLKEPKDLILELLKDDLSDVFVFVENGPVPKENFYTLLFKKSKPEEFSLLSKTDLRKWVRKEFSRYQVRIQEKALSLILDYIGNDLWSLSMEISKLSIFKGRGKEIMEKDIKHLVVSSADLSIFKVIDSILLRDKKKALQLLTSYLEKGKSIFVLFATLASSLRNVLLVKDGLEQGYSYRNISENLKISPFIFRKSYQFSQRYNLPELKKNYQKIFLLDNSIKKGKITPELAFFLLLFDF